jgi:hypothetical protein
MLPMVHPSTPRRESARFCQGMLVTPRGVASLAKPLGPGSLLEYG